MSQVCPPVSRYTCTHYTRGCQLVAPCCGEVVPCRICHDEDSGCPTKLDRRAVREIVCKACGARQPPSRVCAEPGCGSVLGDYFCAICNLWDDEGEAKQIYHCEGCGICRVGGRENFFHCDKCCACYAIHLRGAHVCVEASLKHNCPVCLEYLFDSREGVQVLPCGHTLHASCHRELLKSGSYTCPTCNKSTIDMSRHFAALKAEIALVPMPEEYRDRKVAVLCADCQHTTPSAPWHVLGVECERCGSFNTRETAEVCPPAGPGAEVGAERAEPMDDDEPETDDEWVDADAEMPGGLEPSPRALAAAGIGQQGEDGAGAGAGEGGGGGEG